MPSSPCSRLTSSSVLLAASVALLLLWPWMRLAAAVYASRSLLCALNLPSRARARMSVSSSRVFTLANARPGFRRPLSTRERSDCKNAHATREEGRVASRSRRRQDQRAPCKPRQSASTHLCPCCLGSMLAQHLPEKKRIILEADAGRHGDYYAAKVEATVVSGAWAPAHSEKMQYTGAQWPNMDVQHA